MLTEFSKKISHSGEESQVNRIDSLLKTGEDSRDLGDMQRIYSSLSMHLTILSAPHVGSLCVGALSVLANPPSIFQTSSLSVISKCSPHRKSEADRQLLPHFSS